MLHIIMTVSETQTTSEESFMPRVISEAERMKPVMKVGVLRINGEREIKLKTATGDE